MKIQISGFDIEINEDGTNLSIKVMDSTGTELSNNSYQQNISTDDTIQDTELPAVDEVAPEDTMVDDSETENTETENTEEVENQETTDEIPEQTEAEEDEAQVMGESLLVDFETFKKNLKK